MRLSISDIGVPHAYRPRPCPIPNSHPRQDSRHSPLATLENCRQHRRSTGFIRLMDEGSVWMLMFCASFSGFLGGGGIVLFGCQSIIDLVHIFHKVGCRILFIFYTTCNEVSRLWVYASVLHISLAHISIQHCSPSVRFFFKPKLSYTICTPQLHTSTVRLIIIRRLTDEFDTLPMSRSFSLRQCRGAAIKLSSIW